MVNLYFFVLPLAAVIVAQPITEEPHGDISIHDVQKSGSGCIGTNATIVDGKIHLGPLQTLKGAVTSDGSRARWQSNCQIHADIRFPEGQQVAVRVEGVSGTAKLDEGVTAAFMYQQYFSQKASETFNFQESISNGPFSSKPENFATDKVLWSSCSGNTIANANFRVALHTSSTTAVGEAILAHKTPIVVSFISRPCTK